MTPSINHRDPVSTCSTDVVRTIRLTVWAVLAAALAACATSKGAPLGREKQPAAADKEAMTALGGKANGLIVWSSSRLGNHDLFVMNTDGSNVHPITKGDTVDWFPRFSPDGSHILFSRSKKGWVPERDANAGGKWDIYTIKPDGQEETKVVDDASWGGWVSKDEIVYVRSTAVFRRLLAGGAETLLVDSKQVPDLQGALVQQPELSKDGAYLALTLRGSKNETGVWDIAKKTWTRTGEGSQIGWNPGGDEIYWVHPSGNGGSRVLHRPMAEGKPSKEEGDLDALILIDLPGKRSHESFPTMSADGKWLVMAASLRANDSDVVDHDLYLWEVGTSSATAVRLTHHTGNDRWPDIFIAEPKEGEGAAKGKEAAAAEEKPAPGKAGKKGKKKHR